MLGLRFCARAFSSCSERGPPFIAVRGPLTVAASLAAEHRLQTRRLSSCGSRAPLLRGMWDLPRPGLEPVSPALAGRFSTTAPPGKPCARYSYFPSQIHSSLLSTTFFAPRCWPLSDSNESPCLLTEWVQNSAVTTLSGFRAVLVTALLLECSSNPCHFP